MNLITVREAAQELKVSSWRIYDLIRRGLLPPGVVVRLGRQLRIDRDALERWVAAGGQGLAGE